MLLPHLPQSQRSVISVLLKSLATPSLSSTFYAAQRPVTNLLSRHPSFPPSPLPSNHHSSARLLSAPFLSYFALLNSTCPTDSPLTVPGLPSRLRPVCPAYRIPTASPVCLDPSHPGYDSQKRPIYTPTPTTTSTTTRASAAYLSFVASSSCANFDKSTRPPSRDSFDPDVYMSTLSPADVFSIF
jgi:hypothetical protein